MTAEQKARDMLERMGGDIVELANLIAASAHAADGLGAWQPIETAPRDGTEVLVCRRYEDGHAEYAVAYCYEDDDGWRDIGDIGWAGMQGGPDNQPTHWMPLPTPPEAPNAV